MQLLLEQGSPEWLEARRGKITASFAGAILGVDKHTGPLSAFNQITGKTVKRDNPAMKYGRENEAAALSAYEDNTGVLVAPGGFWVHDQLPWLGASPDGLAGTDGLVEIKCPARIPAEVPLQHVCQMCVQLYVTGRVWCDYYIWTPEGDWTLRIDRDPVWEAKSIPVLAAFYENHILTGTPPPRRRPKKGATTDAE